MPDNWDPMITPQEPESTGPDAAQPENPPEAGTGPTQIAHPEYSGGQYGQYEPPTSPPEYPTIGEPATTQQYAPPFQPPYNPGQPFTQVPPAYPPAQPGAGQPSYPPMQPPQGQIPYSPAQPPEGQAPYPPVQPPYPAQPVPGGYPPQPPAQYSAPYPQGGYPPAQPAYPGYAPQQAYPAQMLGEAPMYQAPVVTEKGSKTGVIVGVVIAVVVLVLVGVGIRWMAGGSSNSTSSGPVASRPANPTYNPSGSATPSSSASPSQPGTLAPPPAVEGTVTVDMDGYGPVDYTVTGSADLMDEVGGFYTPDDGNIFVGVPVTITYRGDEDMYFVDIDDTALVTQDGDSHGPDFTAVVLSDPPGANSGLAMSVLEPGESVSGTLVYEIDSDSTEGAVLMVGVTTDNPVTLTIGL